MEQEPVYLIPCFDSNCCNCWGDNSQNQAQELIQEEEEDPDQDVALPRLELTDEAIEFFANSEKRRQESKNYSCLTYQRRTKG